MSRPLLNRKICKECDKKLDGYSRVYCRECSTKKTRANLLKNYGTTNIRKVIKYVLKMRESDRKYQKNKRSTLIGYKTEEYRIYREKYPDKVLAQQRLNSAIRLGRIKRSPCEVCGIEK